MPPRHTLVSKELTLRLRRNDRGRKTALDGRVLSVFMFGLSFGLVLFLLAAGLTLTMGLMRIINLAHGALYMMGGYVGLSVAGYAHNYWVGVLAGAVCAGLIGLLLEIGFLRRLYGHPTSQVLLTIGFIYIYQRHHVDLGLVPLSAAGPGHLLRLRAYRQREHPRVPPLSSSASAW